MTALDHRPRNRPPERSRYGHLNPGRPPRPAP